LRQDVVTYTCENGHDEREMLDRRKSTPDHECSRCGEAVSADEAEREDAIDHLMDIADQRGTETLFISTDFEKGDQPLRLRVRGRRRPAPLLDRRLIGFEPVGRE